MVRQVLLVGGMLAAIAIAATAQRFVPPHAERIYSLDETERLVSTDLATSVNSAIADVQVAERSARRWSSGDLCASRPADDEPGSVDGYAFTLKHGQGRYDYRADRQGNVPRCRIVRPLDP